MITTSPVNTNSLASPYQVFKSTDTGATGGTAQDRAITTIILCNTGTPDSTDETVNAVNVNIHLVKSTGTVTSPKTTNLVVSNLTIPAGETFFFSEERIVLDGNDSIYIGATSGGTETTGAFTVGANYTILNVGDTDFTLIGASANTPGVHFTATGTGGGTTGTAIRNLISCTVSSLVV